MPAQSPCHGGLHCWSVYQTFAERQTVPQTHLLEPTSVCGQLSHSHCTCCASPRSANPTIAGRGAAPAPVSSAGAAAAVSAVRKPKPPSVNSRTGTHTIGSCSHSALTAPAPNFSIQVTCVAHSGIGSICYWAKDLSLSWQDLKPRNKAIVLRVPQLSRAICIP